jgi:hypothetical protein
LEAIMQQGSDVPPPAEVAPPGIDTNVPHSARIYDYWLNGKDNFAVDRAVDEAMIQAIPGMRYMAGENRKFVHRAARDLVGKEGIRQFLDIGTGHPDPAEPARDRATDRTRDPRRLCGQ